MSQYTIVNIIGDYEEQSIKSVVEIIPRSISRVRGDTCIARYGGDKRDAVLEKFLDEKTGKLLYDLSVAEEGKGGFLFIDVYEDTGNSHETSLYKYESFGKATKIDQEEFVNDRRGQEVKEYYDENHGLNIKYLY